MKELGKDFKNIYHQDRKILVLMGFVLVFGLVLMISAFVGLDATMPKLQAAQYSDMAGGYRDGDWWYLLSFALLGVLLGVVHNLLAARLFAKRSGSVAILFLVTSLVITAIAIAFLWRILGEN